MLIFLYGNDVFRSTEKLNDLKENFLKKNTSNANSSVFDFSENDSFEKLQSMFLAEGLFSSKKLVIVKNIIDSADKEVQEKMVKYLEKNNLSKDITIIFWEKNEPRKNGRLFKKLVENCKSENFEKLLGAKLTSWVKEEFDKREVVINSGTINKLISFVGDDLFQMENEIDKLSNFAGRRAVKEEDIDLIVKSKIEANIFDTIEAIGAREKGRALKFFHEQIEKGDDPFYILSMYIYQFRNLIKIGSFYFDGINDREVIARETKLHPFVVQKGIIQLREFSLRKLKLIYKQLEELDGDIKTGKVEIREAMDRFIVGV